LKTCLDDLVLNELSFVDKAANPGARVTIFKADDLDKNRGQMRLQGPGPMDYETPLRPHEDFESAIDAYQSRHKVPRYIAMSRVRRERSDLYDRYQKNGAVKKTADDFDALVAEAIAKVTSPHRVVRVEC